MHASSLSPSTLMAVRAAPAHVDEFPAPVLPKTAIGVPWASAKNYFCGGKLGTREKAEDSGSSAFADASAT